jgi:N-acetylmuramoyl-L-alanine amidase
VFGAATESAVRQFQGSRGLPSTGECDIHTWTFLLESEFGFGDRMLCLRTPMMRGEDVAEAQLRLGTLGFDSGRVDGIFGPTTQKAVGDFQRNAGLIFDQVCGPDTFEALRRLQGRTGSASVTSVRERVELERVQADLRSLRVAIGEEALGGKLTSSLAAQLSPFVSALTLTAGDWSDQARAANDFDASLFLGILHSTEDVVESYYFSVPGFESVGGRTLADLILSEMPAAPGVRLGRAKGMRLPILRETKPPAVLVKVGPSVIAGHRDDLVVNSLHRAVERWVSTTSIRG